MSKIDTSQINWTVVCVYEFAKDKAMKPKAAFRYLLSCGGIQYLKDFFAIEHTLSWDDTIEALDIICRQNGGQL